MKRLQKVIVWGIIIIMLSACSSAPKKIIPQSINKADEKLAKANNLLHQGMYYQSKDSFFEAYKYYSLSDNLLGCAYALTGLSNALINLDQKTSAFLFLDKAQQYYTAADDKYALSNFYLSKALLLIQTDEPKQAEKELQTAENMQPNSVEITITKAFIEFKQKNYQKAYEILNTLNPENIKQNSFYFYTLGIIQTELNLNTKAQTSLLTALKLDKENGLAPKTAADLEALYMLGKKSGDLKTAKSYLLRSLKIYSIIGKTDKINFLINELKNMNIDKEQDMSVENFFMNLWINN